MGAWHFRIPELGYGSRVCFGFLLRALDVVLTSRVWVRVRRLVQTREALWDPKDVGTTIG